MYRIGIDEVGRGPLAGPVVVAAVALKSGQRLPKSLGDLRDSKKLTKASREAWATWIRANVPHAFARSTPASIDTRNISACANACAARCYARVVEQVGEAPVHLDGGLFLGSKLKQREVLRATTEPKADERYPEVALASILAKVTRDAMMARYHRKYPIYAFDRNAGYGTQAHYAALREAGPCPIHRLTFLRTLGTMGPLL